MESTCMPSGGKLGLIIPRCPLRYIFRFKPQNKAKFSHKYKNGAEVRIFAILFDLSDAPSLTIPWDSLFLTATYRDLSKLCLRTQPQCTLQQLKNNTRSEMYIPAQIFSRVIDKFGVRVAAITRAVTRATVTRDAVLGLSTSSITSDIAFFPC